MPALNQLKGRLLAVVAIATAALAVNPLKMRAQDGRPSSSGASPAPSPAPISSSPSTDRVFAAVERSLVTVEVHSGNREAKSSLGSGYVVGPKQVVTNYHVIESFIDEPERYQIRLRGKAGETPAALLAFDIENDLAVLEPARLDAPALTLAEAVPPAGSSVVSLGNPHGLGLSLIGGIFNGFAHKGAVARMLLSMPLNSGMSGGPILDSDNRVIGTNVSVMYLSNSLSFGVPVEKVRPLLARPRVEGTRTALRAEATRQLAQVEETLQKGVIATYASPGDEVVTVGGLETRRPPDLFDCWDDTQVFSDQGITKARFGCDLEFSPQLGRVGAIGAAELLVEHFTSTKDRLGFYDYLEDHGPAHLEVEASDPEGGVTSAPHCVSDRVRTPAAVWKVNTCVSALVAHPGFFNFDVVATSVDRSHEAAFVAVHLKGVQPATFTTFTNRALTSVRFRNRS